MGFKMNGSPAKLGTIQGTAGHRSALKQNEEQKVKETSWWRGQEGVIPDEWQGGDKRVMVDGKKVSKLKHVESGGKLPEGSELTKDQKKKQEAKKTAEKPTAEKKMKSEDWKKGQERAKSKGDDLDALVSKRKGMKKGSDEYNVVQNKINRALGDKTRHGVTTTTKGKTTTEVTPGTKTTATTDKRKESSIAGGKVTKKTKYDSGTTKTTKLKTSDKGGATVSGVENVRKAKTKTKRTEIGVGGGAVDTKVKTKYDKSGKVTKEKKTVKKGDVVTKTITKPNKNQEKLGDATTTTKVKTRKKGGTGLGAKIKGIFKKKEKE